MKLQLWHTGIEMVAETIRHDVAHMTASLGVAIQTYRTEDGEGAQIIDATHMIIMDVR